MRQADQREAAEVLRRLLDAVDLGELTADTPAERRNLRRLEGMLTAVEGATTRSRPEPEKLPSRSRGQSQGPQSEPMSREGDNMSDEPKPEAYALEQAQPLVDD